MTQLHTQLGNIITNTKVKIYLILPEFSAAKIVNQECHIDDSVKGIYDMILVKYILPQLGLYIKCLNISLKQVTDL